MSTNKELTRGALKPTAYDKLVWTKCREHSVVYQAGTRICHLCEAKKKQVEVKHTLRATKNYTRVYLENRLQFFANYYAKQYAKQRNWTNKDNIVKSVSFGSGGSYYPPVIKVYYEDGCQGTCVHFKNQAELMAYVDGYLQAIT